MDGSELRSGACNSGTWGVVKPVVQLPNRLGTRTVPVQKGHEMEPNAGTKIF